VTPLRFVVLAYVAALLTMCSTEPIPAHAAEPWTTADVIEALRGTSQTVQCVIQHEVIGTGYSPYSVGQQGELGIAQLHPKGELIRFYAMGYTDPFSPYQSIDFLEVAIAEGRGQAWAPIYWGLC